MLTASPVFLILFIWLLKKITIYDIVSRPDLWTFKTPAFKKRFELMSARLQTKEAILYKLVCTLCLPYVLPPLRLPPS